MGPGKSLFDAIFRSVGNINIIAEDLVCFIRYDTNNQYKSGIVEHRSDVNSMAVSIMIYLVGHLPSAPR